MPNLCDNLTFPVYIKVYNFANLSQWPLSPISRKRQLIFFDFRIRVVNVIDYCPIFPTAWQKNCGVILVTLDKGMRN